MKGISLGFVETWGWVPAMEAADAGLKSAPVNLLGLEIVPVGRVVVYFQGDVAAVRTAVLNGSLAAGKLGRVIAHNVIARPDTQLIPHTPSPVQPPPRETSSAPAPHSEDILYGLPHPGGASSQEVEPTLPLMKEEGQTVSPGPGPYREPQNEDPTKPKTSGRKKTSKGRSKKNLTP